MGGRRFAERCPSGDPVGLWWHTAFRLPAVRDKVDELAGVLLLVPAGCVTPDCDRSVASPVKLA